MQKNLCALSTVSLVHGRLRASAVEHEIFVGGGVATVAVVEEALQVFSLIFSILRPLLLTVKTSRRSQPLVLREREE